MRAQLREKGLPPTCMAPSDPGRASRELTLEVETDGALALLGPSRLTMVRVLQWQSSSSTSKPVQSNCKDGQWSRSSSFVSFLFLFACYLLLADFQYLVTSFRQRIH
jgi:hypothetical protein